jgi:hypothetical protein
VPTHGPSSRPLADHLATHPRSARLLDALRRALGDIGPTEEVVSRSQVAFRRRRVVVRAWVPDQYLGGDHAPLVLTFELPERDASERWKQVLEPAPGRFTHHLELWEPADLDAEVETWLRRAYDSAT